MGDFIGQNPGILGLVVAAVGALILVGAILRWKWIIGGDTAGSTVRTGLLGWIIYKLFGRRVFFILTGAVVLLGGVAWFVVFTFFI